ncbi:unnamed protein product [Acanthoscelides obtectus]|uniref:Uncharacterized protein n=1 Tax=Acanthoscelides obtectus TaxID=200917 RepID=A0A9P0MJM5_ACAOB|nr:unnamed protein product [Acanthoscelides obtectus]CAK1658432.1 hypothetical protein AOBTE_LOCUS20884 [Acanthoscelides obtectus]
MAIYSFRCYPYHMSVKVGVLDVRNIMSKVTSF